MDISGSFHPTISGSRYWVLLVDDFSRMGFCGFLKEKSELASGMMNLIQFVEVQGYHVKIIRCDNARENKMAIPEIQEKYGGITPEFMAPNLLQQNGVVERRFPTLKTRASAMMKVLT